MWNDFLIYSTTYPSNLRWGDIQPLQARGCENLPDWLLLGLEEPTVGRILIDHVDIKNKHQKLPTRYWGRYARSNTLPASIFKICVVDWNTEDQVWYA